MEKLNVKIQKVTVKSVKSAKSKRATVKWTKLSGMDGYVIQYSTKATFKSAKKKTVKASAASATLKSLKKGGKYYVRVRGYKTIDNQKVYTQYSGVKTVKVK